MADQKQQQAGLVKSLLFPAYADAGSNESFKAPSQEDIVSESDATTAVLDNRTASKPQQHHDDDSEQEDVPSTESRPLDDSLVAQTGAESQETFPFSDQPQSPSMLPSKRTMGPRSVSTTTHSGIRPFPTTSPRVANPSLDYSSITAASSNGVSSVVGVNFLNESKAKEEEEKPTPVKDNRSTSDRFQPRLAQLEGDTSSDVFSDVNSTASEMGTVVGAPERLAEVQAMAAFMERSSDGEPLYESESGASDAHISSAKDVPGLSLPTLEERRSEESRASKSREARSSVFREKMDSVFRERDASTPPPPPTDESPSSATAMVSAAIKRLGSGVGNINRAQANKSPSHIYSAPTTPRVVPPSRVEHYLRSSLSSQRSDDQSSSVAHLLRSPGSAVYFQPDGSRRHKPTLAPRFSRTNEAAEHRGTFRQANSLASPLRFARGCLSFDNTIENKQYATIPEEHESKLPLMQYLRRKEAPQSPSPVKQSRSWDATSVTSSTHPHIREPTTPQGTYRSFAFGKSPESATSGAPAASAFRPAPLTRVRHANGFSFNSKPTERFGGKVLNDISPAVANSRGKDILALRTPQRIEIERDDALDILACLVERSVAFDQELAQSSQVETIEEVDENDETLEDEECIDEVTDDKESSPVNGKVELTDDDRVSTFAAIGVRDVKSPPPTRRKSAVDLLKADSFSSDLTDAILMIRKISQDYERTVSGTDDSESNVLNHSMRMKAVDELLRSHTYAAEMRRAAKSASTWLRSIDRLESTSEIKVRLAEVTEDGQQSLGSGSEALSYPSEIQGPKQSAIDGYESDHLKDVDKMDIVALKAMLHSAELKAKEKEDAALRLNEELSKCRAEIGRLRTATRAEKIAFASPNRSILDNDDDSTSSADASTAEDLTPPALADTLDSASPISRVDTDRDASIDASFVRSEVLLEKVPEEEISQWHAIAEAKKEAILLKTALSQANETIRKLYEENLQSTNNNTPGGDTAPIVSVDDNPELNDLLDEYKAAVKGEFALKAVQTPVLQDNETTKELADSPNENDRRTVNVKMLDGENFVTEWDDLAQPLPPPPDHGLRSPIVAALLQQWTSDAAMHNQLLSWMERIMNGADCEAIPPLTISSLDHQVRDGFAMHVLPLLLRRSDILVDVKTRAHRRTYYDMSVSVTSSVLQEHSGNRFTSEGSQPIAPSTAKAKKTQIMAFKASRDVKSMLDESMLVDVGVPEKTYNVSDFLRTSSYARSSDMGSDSVAHSATTAIATNSSKRFAGESRPTRSSARDHSLVPGERTSGRVVDRGVAEMPIHMTTPMFGDDISTSSSTTGGSSQKSTQNAGLMGTIGGAFGGLLRRKQSEPEEFYRESGFDENGFLTAEADAVPSFLRHAPPPSPSRSEDDGQPYHRVVSAPPGRIGVTFVDYRGHAMVSDVANESPLSGWVFPSDILIAIDEVPVSGMRVRDIIKLLTSRKERQRALRVISSHAMNEFTLNTTTPSESGAIS